ncbi:MAG: 4Fe-4S dicluster domain-containing protein [Bacteroidales bacterium]
MNAYFLKENDLGSFVGRLIAATKVIGPVAKKAKFVFGELKAATDLRLDYDCTILPPKKVFFPPQQALLTFKNGQATSAIAPVDQVLFGVHFYDMKAIDMLDTLFAAGHADQNYLANREHTTIVVSNIQAIAPRAFWGSMGADIHPQGHDACITRLEDGYLFQTRNVKGEALVEHGAFETATADQREAAAEENVRVLSLCHEQMKHDAAAVAEKVRASFNDEFLWKKLAEDCLSCGTCNIVCPTCYCFDVQDVWNLDQQSGTRVRTWDGCLLPGFAEVSLGGGKAENFREHPYQRYRHRVMRKTTYLNDKIGGPACVGCGRCALSCLADIADPVHIVDTIMEA